MKELQNLVMLIPKHRAVNNSFYDKWIANKISIENIGLFARNYWELTFQFSEALAMLIINVKDPTVRAEYVNTLYSEMGSGNSSQAHVSLFEEFCNKLSEKMSKPNYLAIKNLKSIHNLLPETSSLINGQKEIYSKNASIAAGAQLALEWQAYTMIRKLYEGARNYLDLWNDQDKFHEACEFFYVHIGQAEKKHKIESITAVEKVVMDGGDYTEVEHGFTRHLELIADFWEGISKSMN